ncbi:Beta-1,3-galactosyltransferase 6 [Entomortierella chlamydospora]|uniref:Beta-1,3-galactosyltransferase 6 n=1 Tax=Entomortierella chlamydospora TaxID=101097 RepID=A0A9P6SYW3_9FUNG|nr:Beta-1,3-galactosyltransferase 6 [Entomortierella chlamydospora]
MVILAMAMAIPDPAKIRLLGGEHCMLSMYWAFLLTTACIQRLLQSHRPPSVVLRIALAHLLSWIMIGAIVTSRPVTEPTRPWVFITFMQSLLLMAVVYLPWLKSQMKAAGLPTLSERLTSHALEDGFMGREINGHSATRFLVLPLIVVGLCSWMLIITRGSSGYLHDSSQGGLIQGTDQPANGYSPSNFAGSFMKEGERQQDDRMVISMIVLSSATPQGFRNRQMFRNTTLRLFPSPRNKAVVVKYRFIIGKSLPTVEHELVQEHNLMGDLLIVSTPDRPDSKSQKLYKAIEWADAFEFDYLVKTEDDVLVRVDTLSGELYKQGKKPYFWKGLVFKNVPNTHLDDMDLKEMPVFTDGTLTTMSRDIVRLLAVPAPRYFVASSAQSLGIWLHGYGIKPVHDTRIQPGAFVCEEDLIAKHFDNELSLYSYPRDDPIKMVERINRIRAELKANKNNRNFQTSISICDRLIQKRCAMCYSCQGRASNWKLMGFDCKQGGVVVGDKYRKPDLLDAKQMDELLNRPSTGVTEGLTPITLKDYRQRQQIQSQNQVNPESTDDEVSETEENPEEESLGEGEEENLDEENLAEGEEETDSEEESALVDEQEAEPEDELLDTQDEEGEEEDGAGEEEEGGQSQEEQDEANHEHHDESEIPISDQEVDFLDRRHDEDQLPAKEVRKKKSQ